jgi:hypothetical protein
VERHARGDRQRPRHSHGCGMRLGSVECPSGRLGLNFFYEIVDVLCRDKVWLRPYWATLGPLPMTVEAPCP